jgi:hypothetical protein
MKSTVIISTLFLFGLLGQQNKDDEQVLTEGDLALSEVLDALSLHAEQPQSFVSVKPNVKEKVAEPGMIVFKNRSLTLEWTNGQHAHSLVENLRISIRELAAQRSEGLDVMALDHANHIWPEVKIIYCHAYPGARYFDLAWHEQYCEEK